MNTRTKVPIYPSRQSLMLGLCFSLLFWGVGCEDMHERRKNIICFVDLSGSVGEENKGAYVNAIKLILRNMGTHDRLLVYPIDEGAYTNPVKIVYEDFMNSNANYGITFQNIPDSIKPPFTRKGDGITKKEEKRRQRIDRYVETIGPLIESRLDSIYHARSKFSSYSNILWALLNCRDELELIDREEAEAFSLEPKIVPYNYIIFLSDMIHEDKEYNFNRKKGILEEDRHEILTGLLDKSRIPDLNGANVIILGKGPGAQVKSEAAIDEIEKFWEIYFSPEYANARLYLYRGIDKIDEIPRFLAGWLE